ncbi:hypothetical protein CEXT_44181 [Caerostris extrusa]|uniref:Uncharacterized protein n=1 Tax=Caerostris extrusa TaxID=172846 RepID=A0AAV4YCE0_CAEEX|nr:hypothetical protein CEXT_44181 [Caerostris extrusa]
MSISVKRRWSSRATGSFPSPFLPEEPEPELDSGRSPYLRIMESHPCISSRSRSIKSRLPCRERGINWWGQQGCCSVRVVHLPPRVVRLIFVLQPPWWVRRDPFTRIVNKNASELLTLKYVIH